MTQYLSKAVNFIMKMLLLLIVCIVFFGTNEDYAYKKTFALPNIVFAVLGATIVVIFSCLAYKIGGILKKKKYANKRNKKTILGK